MIILRKLKWSNAFSYAEDNELILDESILTQVLGGNGVGKSSIPLIIEEIFFNKNSKGTKKVDIPNRNLDSEGYFLGLDFDVDDVDYTISITRKKSLKIKLTKNGEDISSHTATNTFKTIEEILGIDFKTFSQLVYQNTNSSLQFLTATDTNRKRFLIELLNLNKYVEYFETFKGLVKDYNNQVISLESKISTLEAWLSKNNLEGMIVLPKLDLDINSEKDEEALGALTAEFKNISQKNKNISANNLYKSQLARLDIKSVAGIDAQKGSSDSFIQAIGDYKSQKSAANKALKHIESLGDECPTCSQEIDSAFKEGLKSGYKDIVSEMELLLTEFNDKVTKVKENNALFDKKQKIETEFESLYRAIDNNLPEELLHAGELEAKILSIKTILKEKRVQIQYIIDENSRIDKNNTTIQIITEQREGFEQQLEVALSEVKDLSITYSNLEVLKKAFSTNGLLAYKIEYLVKELETIVNEYLSELSDGRFTLTFAVTNDKLNVELTDDGRDVDILSLSSGELARVNTSTLLAIRRLMNSISKSQINVLFLDEVISVLDDPGRERLVDVLSRETKLNTFIVSHEWSHPLLAKLNIVKENNISKLIYD